MTHLDSLYYLRNRTDTALYLESFHYERDPTFSTNADFKVAKLLANDMLSVYLKEELEALEYEKKVSDDPLPAVRLTWQDSKTDLTDLSARQQTMLRKRTANAVGGLYCQRLQYPSRCESLAHVLRYETAQQSYSVARQSETGFAATYADMEASQ